MTALELQSPTGNKSRVLQAGAMKRLERNSEARFLAAGSLAVAIMMLSFPAQAQAPATPGPQPGFVTCPAPGMPLLPIPEIVSANGFLRGTILLRGAALRMTLGTTDPNGCRLQFVRQFSGANTTPAGYGAPNPPGPYPDPAPGPTLRARVGDIVQLTFLNQIDPGPFGNSIDRGERGQGCDESTQYPGLDQFPDCFHGSSTGNIHFHGTHTNPSTTGDNVFIEVRPSPRHLGQPVVTEASVQEPFADFFSVCEGYLRSNVLSQWPRSWSDLPAAWTSRQEALLKAYDSNPSIANKLWPVNAAQIEVGAWPQYYIGAFPYCFSLPRYTPPPPKQAVDAAHVAHAAMGLPEDRRTLLMGQSPGTHWYHAHKHGSTTLNVMNGMTGAFIIEGPYDDAFNAFYGKVSGNDWTRTQPVLVVNQLGTSTNLIGGAGGRQFSVNGRVQPTLTMAPGEVQLWRIANTSSRSGVFIAGFGPPDAKAPSSPQIFHWKQTAQDGVQFAGANYQSSQDPNLLIAAGNRADLLVQAPASPGQYALLIAEARSRCETLPPSQVPTIPVKKGDEDIRICGKTPPLSQLNVSPLVIVNVTGSLPAGNRAQFIPADQLGSSFPSFLKDITDDEVKATKTVVFESFPTPVSESSPTPPNPGAMHTIDGQKFDGNIGQVVLLNTVEEWKIVNRTVNGGIKGGAPTGPAVTTDPPGVVDHPFHIHINPFQIVEFFDPNEVLPNGTAKYIFDGTPMPGQCLLDLAKPESWKPCDSFPKTNLIWWDVFSIPSARAIFTGTAPNQQVTVVPGYFKMRSRFVDYSGQYVIHCHILAHEDRGMMTIVEVVPFTTAYSHK
jgi:FtsP/CotA-like multicopper oxidase with cupredoxin domain